MGLLRFLFGRGGPSSVAVEKDRARRKDIPQIVGTGPAPPRSQPRTLPPKAISPEKPAQPAGPLPPPDPSAQQNVTLPYCRYAKREERAERAQIVYRHACAPGPTILKGKCYVIDGDSISINSVPIRLAGIDAPELDHPYGNNAKWAMVAITKGQIITARIAPEMSYDRTVAICCLPDGRDIAAELVKQGLALDWPLFSKGLYKEYEPEGVRRKLWMTTKRQPPPAKR